MKQTSWISRVTLSIACFALFTAGASAATLIWHPSQGMPQPPGGSGEWVVNEGGPQNVWRDEAGNKTVWSNGSDALLTGAPGIISVTSNVTVNNLTANASGYVINADSLEVTGTLTLAENVTLTLNGGGVYNFAAIAGEPGSQLILEGAILRLTGNEGPFTSTLSLSYASLNVEGQSSQLAGMVVQNDSIIDFGTAGGLLSLSSLSFNGGSLAIYNWYPLTSSIDFGPDGYDPAKVIFYSDAGITQISPIPEPRTTLLGILFYFLILIRRNTRRQL